MSDNQQLITIKGTRDGLTLLIDDTCSYEAIIDELEKLTASTPKNNERVVSVTVQLGQRYFTTEQKEQVSKIIEEKSQLAVHSFQSEVLLKDEAKQWYDESETKVLNRIVRSGQVLEVTGDLLLIGDVNPGGKIITTGNIYVMGNLLGIAHAGSNGDQKAIIAASYMEPSQLRIANYISRAPDYESTGVYMECGLIDENEDKIVINRLQVLSHMRKDLSGFERRIENG